MASKNNNMGNKSSSTDHVFHGWPYFYYWWVQFQPTCTTTALVWIGWCIRLLIGWFVRIWTGREVRCPTELQQWAFEQNLYLRRKRLWRRRVFRRCSLLTANGENIMRMVRFFIQKRTVKSWLVESSFPSWIRSNNDHCSTLQMVVNR